MLRKFFVSWSQAGRYYIRRLKFQLGLSLPKTVVRAVLRGVCNVCGREVEFCATDSSNYRESLYCSHCNSTARTRMLASGVLQVMANTDYKSIAQLAAAADGPRIFDTDCYSPIFQLLRNADFYSSSVYVPQKEFGITIYPKVINVNLEKMPFLDQSFDVILTSDVMEHVRRDDLAHAEIYRCLKPSGYYIFTVPFVPLWEKNQVRVDATGDEDVYLMEKEYHGDPVTGAGVLVYRIYGNELIQQLRNLGFDVNLDNQSDETAGMPTKDLFICRKVS